MPSTTMKRTLPVCAAIWWDANAAAPSHPIIMPEREKADISTRIWTAMGKPTRRISRMERRSNICRLN